MRDDRPDENAVYIQGNKSLFYKLRSFNPSLAGIMQNDMWVKREQIDDWVKLAVKLGLKRPLLTKVLSYIDGCTIVHR